ncbi:hypothetical protein YC2023_094334 [Brassica napus]
MEFLETFGCIWSSKEVIRVVFGRALPGATSRSDGSDVLKSLPKLGATLPERQGEVARHFGSRKHEIALGATSRSDPARIVSKLKVNRLIDRLPSLVRNLITRGLIPISMSSLFQ